ncbi:hypothetical protein [Salinicoccus halodurans]|uniref:Uncharacterized protein n=1 Tax=Salinicoccus halodurans TaxID=407035 RepID=A0A0F7HP63_9STAP|nr:hypothetical protein [Salinicoccus halodurans]AKG74951.1 hypothetical protein AAT16_12595 [Salinicoccus halodurans]SFK67893.1 hypothetical protein SAMN05216235_1112 [Salinicoccus halodurans]
MIVKTVNSYDIHIHGQLLRVIEKNELRAGPEGFDVKKLLLNEPRGSKYMNLLIFHEDEITGGLTVTLDSITGIENEDVLLKSFVSSLVDRGRIEKKESYSLDFNGRTKKYGQNELIETPLYEVGLTDGLYEVNHKKIKLVETGLHMDIQYITSIKKEIEKLNDSTYDYLVLSNDGKHAAANKNNDILPYPIIEVISLFDRELGTERTTTLNGDDIKIQNGRFEHAYQLISNSQFYIDHTDIYTEGFVIK